MVEICETQEASNVSEVVRLWPVGDYGGLPVIHAYMTKFDDHAKVFDVVTIELTFLRLQVQVVFFEMLQDFVCCLSVYCLIGTVDQHVVHIDGHLSSSDQICENRVYKCLEHGE